MRQTIRTFILLSLSLGVSANLYAQNIEECQSWQKTVVFFGNGMETSEDEANGNKRKLQEALEKDVQDGKITCNISLLV